MKAMIKRWKLLWHLMLLGLVGMLSACNDTYCSACSSDADCTGQDEYCLPYSNGYQTVYKCSTYTNQYCP